MSNKRKRRVSWVPAEEVFTKDNAANGSVENGTAAPNHLNGERRRNTLDTTNHLAHPAEKLSNGTANGSATNINSEYAAKEPSTFLLSAYYPLVSQQPNEATYATSTTGIPTHKAGPITAKSFTAASTFLEQNCRVDGSFTQRALETLAVGFYVWGFVFAPLVLSLAALIVLFFPPLWVFAFAYLCWYIYDYRTPKNGSRPWRRFRELPVWSYMANYFPMKLIKTAELPADRNYIVGAHPHGILSFGTFLTFCTEAAGFAELYPNLQRRYAVTLPIQYWFPIRRELLMLTNTISSEVSAIEHVLQESEQGTVVGIVAGGAAEALDSRSDNFRLTLKNRKGFIKLAIKYGASLVPMYTFGETSTYNQVANPEGSRIRRFQNSLKGLTGITLPFFYGCGVLNSFFGFLPYRTPLYTVVGKPIEVSKVPEPTNAQVNQIHERYCRELSELFDAHKQKYGIGPHVKLEFV